MRSEEGSQEEASGRERWQRTAESWEIQIGGEHTTTDKSVMLGTFKDKDIQYEILIC